MKKALIVSLAVLTAAVLVPGELAAGVGIKGGFNFANWRYSGPGAPDFDFVNLRGPVVGGFVSFGLGPVAIQPEVYYSRRGARVEEGADWMEFRLDYLEIPVLVKLTFMPGPFSPVVFGGPYGSLLLSANLVTEIDGTGIKEDIKDSFATNDYGLVLGGGFEFKLVALKLIVEGRYTMGMANVIKDSPDEAYKNKGFSVLVGIGF